MPLQQTIKSFICQGEQSGYVAIRYGYSYWDSLIIATALQSNCRILYSEDMQHNQLIEEKLRIINPLI